MTVYLDSVFALNFAVNWLLLRAAGSRSLTACISFFSSSNILMIPPLEKNMNAQEYFLSPSLGLV